MRALIVDDDRTLADLLAFTFRRAGFEALLAFNAPDAMRLFQTKPLDIIILDVNLPGDVNINSGFDVCREIRKSSNVPIIMLTVRDDEDDIIKGLNLGADDYVSKPFSPRQLVARVQTVLRRTKEGQHIDTAPYVSNDVHFDASRREFQSGDSPPVVLTRLESRLLEVLMLNANQVLPAEHIIVHVWEPGEGTPDMLRQLVRRLRQKVEKDPSNPQLIKNLPGIGYKFSS